jgi:hypothetical protein
VYILAFSCLGLLGLNIYNWTNQINDQLRLNELDKLRSPVRLSKGDLVAILRIGRSYHVTILVGSPHMNESDAAEAAIRLVEESGNKNGRIAPVLVATLERMPKP